MLLLITDFFMYALSFIALLSTIKMIRSPQANVRFFSLLKNPMTIVCSIILLVYFNIALLDSIHFTNKIGTKPTASLLDKCLSPLGQENEVSYSSPFSLHTLTKSINLQKPSAQPQFRRLHYAGKQLKNPKQKRKAIFKLAMKGIFKGCIFFGIISFLCLILSRLWSRLTTPPSTHRLSKINNQAMTHPAFISSHTLPIWKTAGITVFVLTIMISLCLTLAHDYHILGTDKVGQDVFYMSIKSIRTSWILGCLTLTIMLPFAIFLGLIAGYFSGWVDSLIQFVYTTLSAIPSVLLIAASFLSLQMALARHPSNLGMIQQADRQLITLCCILGLTSWAPLCRLLRGEALKLRQRAFIESAKTLGIRPLTLLYRHLLPNVMHLVLITATLDFSNLVLTESLLSYLGIGVNPTLYSFGNMINAGRLELSRDPIVWWPLLGAFMMMFGLVFTCHHLADRLRDICDPSLAPHIDQTSNSTKNQMI